MARDRPGACLLRRASLHIYVPVPPHTALPTYTLTIVSAVTDSIRVPEVFAWNSDPANPVGTEYIIMEKMPGIALSTKWAETQLADRYKIIQQVVEMEKELVRFKFSAYGSLFMRGWCLMDIAIVHFLQTWILPGCFALDHPAVYLFGATTSFTCPQPGGTCRPMVLP